MRTILSDRRLADPRLATDDARGTRVPRVVRAADPPTRPVHRGPPEAGKDEIRRPSGGARPASPSTGVVLATLALAGAVLPTPGASLQADRLYGRVQAEDGEVLEGYLRWDRNEASWADFLDGAKELPWEHLRTAERLDEAYARRRALERSLVVGDLRIAWDEDPAEEPQTSPSGVRFGHVAWIRPLDRARARLRLASGEELDLVARGTDLGTGFRALVVDRPGREAVELRWRELVSVELGRAPADAAPPTGRRLHGTLRTRSGRELTGFVAWDLDETLTTDVLDGDADGIDHAVPFGEIAAIEREGDRAARVLLTNGEVLVLGGTNDVNASNRGIEVSDPETGRGVVRWSAFDALRFHPPAVPPPDYERFDGGRPLRGVVETTSGRSVRGRIRWDNDEAWTWETLDGFSGDVELAVELAMVREIVRVPDHGVEVTMRDGRTLPLAASEDVDDRNRGVFVTSARGETVLVRWGELRRVVLEP